MRVGHLDSFCFVIGLSDACRGSMYIAGNLLRS